MAVILGFKMADNLNRYKSNNSIARMNAKLKIKQYIVISIFLVSFTIHISVI